jgi:hypothetical protein
VELTFIAGIGDAILVEGIQVQVREESVHRHAQVTDG